VVVSAHVTTSASAQTKKVANGHFSILIYCVLIVDERINDRAAATIPVSYRMAHQWPAIPTHNMKGADIMQTR